MTISIVTPSYNQAAFLESTIRSVLAQRRFVHEYFVVDGGSQDGSLEIIKQYSSAIDWWVSERDAGQSDAIDRGFRRATGDVVAWLNSDDIYLPGALKHVQEAFDADKGLQMVTGYMVLIDAMDRILGTYKVPAPSRLGLRLGPVQVCQPSTFMRRSLYLEVGGLDKGLHCAMDRDLWARFYLRRPAWRTIPLHLAAFRKHAESKGGAARWAETYRAEAEVVSKRYPSLSYPAAQAFGLFWYRFAQIASGRQLASVVQSGRLRGKTVSEVFGVG